MPLDYDHLMALKIPDREFSYTDRDTILYAIAVGMGRRAEELRFVYERGLVALPTLATVIAWDDSWQEATGMEIPRIVHGGMEIALHHPLPVQGRIRSSVRIRDVLDKGVGRGAILTVETGLRDAATDAPLATLLSTVFARGDGGFGGPQGRSAPPHPIPGRPPDQSVTVDIRPEQALLYRLCGDRDPLHADPAFARAAGFDGPILHGLCTWGLLQGSVVRATCPAAPQRIRSFGARFTAPVRPGDTLTTDIWQDGDVVSFRAHVGATVVLDHGRALIPQEES
jgi:acyl dehydratase